VKHSYLAVTNIRVNAVTWSDNTSERGLKSHHRLEITGIEEALTRSEDEYTNEALEVHISSHIFNRIRARCRNYMVCELLFELYPKHALQPSQLCGTRKEQTKKKLHTPVSPTVTVLTVNNYRTTLHPSLSRESSSGSMPWPRTSALLIAGG